jgi:phosphopantetheinyl transferase
MALTPGERRLGAGHDPDAWVARLWTAKEAAAKAAGTGLRGRPEELEAVEIDGDWTRIGDRWIRTEQEGEFVVSYVARR